MSKSKYLNLTEKRAKPMREILYRNLTSLKDKRRVISVSDKSQDKNVSTHIHRTFIYVVSQEVEEVSDLPVPVFFITKNFNTKTKEERFFFRMKGIFYVTGEAGFLMVHFCHSLKIDIIPKVKVVSQK